MFEFMFNSDLEWHLWKFAVPFSDFRITTGAHWRNILKAHRPIATERGIFGAAAFPALKKRHNEPP
jgi:hypothetical protein